MLRKLLLLKQRSQVLEKLKENKDSFEKLEVRKKELEVAIDEIKTDEEKTQVEEMVKEFEDEVNANKAEKETLESKLEEIDGEIKEIDENEIPTNPSNEESEERNKNNSSVERSESIMTRGKYFAGLTRESLNTHTQREDVKEFIENVRSKVSNTRSIKGGELAIPTVTLDLIRDNLHTYSKLINYVNLRKINGKARQNIMGIIPEAVWTEMCGKLNELDFDFSFVEIDGYKVAGYVPVCNSLLEDADTIDLYNEILFVLSQAIGLALDKAIIYGKGVKMPLGIVTRLAQAADPNTSSPIKGLRKWVNLKTSNILKINGSAMEAKEFFSALIKNAGAMKANYSRGDKVWVMNSKTKSDLISKAITFDASGSVVANIDNKMPILTGDIVILEFMKDGDIVGGYFDLYLLGERAGGTFGASEHAQYIEDNTVFKGTARYDGQPVIPEGFIAINISNTAFTETLEFAQDKAALSH